VNWLALVVNFTERWVGEGYTRLPMTEDSEVADVIPLNKAAVDAYDTGLPAEITTQQMKDRATLVGNVLLSGILEYVHLAVHPEEDVRKEAEEWLERIGEATHKRPPLIS